MRGNYAGNYSQVPYEPVLRLPPSVDTASPVTPSLLPPRLANEYYTTDPFANFVPWAPVRRVTPIPASALPISPPSQRFDSLPEFSASIPWQPAPAKVLPPSASTVPTRQSDQRFDTLPDLNDATIPWQSVAKILPPSSSLVPTRAPSQLTNPPLDMTAGWTPWQPVPVRLSPAFLAASLVPTRQPDQRFDPLPPPYDLLPAWQPVRRQTMSSVASAVPTVAPSQRFDPLPDLWGNPSPWLILPAKLVPPPLRLSYVACPRLPNDFYPVDVPTSAWVVPAKLIPVPFAPSMFAPIRSEALPETPFVFWTQSPTRLPSVVSFVLARSPSQATNPPGLLDDIWWRIPSHLPPDVMPPSLLLRRAPDQRFDPLPDLNPLTGSAHAVWWQMPQQSGGSGVHVTPPTFTGPFFLVIQAADLKVPYVDQFQKARQ